MQNYSETYLYLIPTPLDNDNILKWITKFHIDIIKNIDVFIISIKENNVMVFYSVIFYSIVTLALVFYTGGISLSYSHLWCMRGKEGGVSC